MPFAATVLSSLLVPDPGDDNAVLDGTARDHLTFLTTAAGQPFTAGGFGFWFRKMCDEAGLAGLSAHGLRKAACRRLAEAGCTEKQIAAIFERSARALATDGRMAAPLCRRA
jgi:hypothetical protein